MDITLDKRLPNMKGKLEEGSESLAKQFLIEIYRDGCVRREGVDYYRGPD